MKTLRNFVLGILLTSMIIPTVNANTFTDVSSLQENHIAIEYLVSTDTIQGYSDGTFKPDQTINRAELMKILVAGQGIEPDENTYKNCFPDVTTDWYAKYVCYAKEQNWVAGYPDGTFKPAQTVNRAEAVKMIIGAYGLSATEANSSSAVFDDVSPSDWFYGYVATLATIGVIETSESAYLPADEINRGLTAEYIFRVLVANGNDAGSYTETQRDEFLTANGLESLLTSNTSETYAVDYVVDGDTIRLVGGEYVRLLGINSPEKSACYYDEAKAHLEDLIGDSQVQLESDPVNDDRDVYDRLLRYVIVDGINLDLQMIQDGYAEYYDSYDISYATDFANAEDQASASNLGMWTCGTDTENDTVSSGSSEGISISEVFYDGEVYQVESDEYVEITNGGTTTVNLEDFYIMGSKGDEKYTFPTLELAPGESVKVYTNQGDYNFGSEDALWSNSGETVYLYDEGGNIVDEEAY